MLTAGCPTPSSRAAWEKLPLSTTRTKNLLAVGEYDGHPDVVPQAFGTPVIYVNRDIVKAAGLNPDKPPRTWEEMRQQALQNKQNTGKYGLFFGMGGDLASQQMMVNAGADMLSPDMTRATFASPDGIAAMQLWQDMFVTDKSVPTLTDKESQSFFMGGQIGMYIGSIATFQQAVRTANGVFDLGVAPYPTWGDKPHRVPNSGSGLMLFSGDELHRDAALRFLAYMVSPDVANRWAVTSGYLPISVGAKDAQVIRDYVAKEPRWGVAVKQMDDLVATARWPGTRIVEMQTVLGNMVAALAQNKGTAATLVPQAEQQITDLIKAGTE